MPKQAARLAGLAFAAAALAFVAAPSAQAGPVPGDVGHDVNTSAGGSFDITVAAEDHADVNAESTFTCYPHSGGHPRVFEACAQLAEVEGRVEDIPPQEGPCTLEYAPVILSVEGVWRGEHVAYSEEFANFCIGNLATGGVVFDVR